MGRRRMILARGIAVGLAIGIGGSWAAAADWTDQDAVSSAREMLADLMASDRIDRVDFQSDTFDGAMELIYKATDVALDHCRQDQRDPTEAARVASSVLEAFNTHRSRGLATTLLDAKEFPIATAADATALGDMLGTATVLVREFVGPDASAERIRATATNLFRSVVIDPDGGLSYLRQYLEHVDRVAGLPVDQRARFLEER